MKATEMTNIGNKKSHLLLIHILGWGLVFGIPFFFMEKESQEEAWRKYIGFSIVPLSSMIVFYANYFYLINRFLFKKQIIKYCVANIVIVVAVIVTMQLWRETVAPKHVLEAYRVEKRLDADNQIRTYTKVIPDFNASTGKLTVYKKMFFISRDLIPIILIIGLSVAIRMTQNWYRTETERRELEKSRTEAELKNLKSQLNPHFLFNTLNNIYSLIAFSPEKAQQSIHDLSKLLRYVLYDNNQHFVPISKELVFIENYISLMKIRLSEAVKIDVNISNNINPCIQIAPLLFITLIENAFKHGISYSEPSFISIDIHEKENGIICRIENSYFPKDGKDKSGSGIGLPNLQKRLTLLYPGKYSLFMGKEENTYKAVLTLSTL